MFASLWRRSSFAFKKKNYARTCTTTTEPEVLVTKNGFSRIITLNRPKSLNSLNLSMIKQLKPLYKEFETDLKISNIILKSNGRAFCAGGDVVAIYESGKDSDFAKEFFHEEYTLDHLIGSLKLTSHVAIMNGITMGGGAGISINGRYRVATENTLFAMPETSIGFIPDVGASVFLSRIGAIGMYMALTGFRLNGPQTYAVGIATHYTRSEFIPEIERHLANATYDGEVKQVLDNFNVMPSVKEMSIPHSNHINYYFKRILDLDTLYFRLKQERTGWGRNIVEQLRKVCPTSLLVTISQLKKNQVSLDGALRSEYRVVTRFMKEDNFFEGVRAVLVDKDKNPKWTPEHHNEITPQQVEDYFDFLPKDQEHIPEYHGWNEMFPPPVPPPINMKRVAAAEKRLEILQAQQDD